MRATPIELSERQKDILRLLEKKSRRKVVYATDISFDELSRLFNMTRQGMTKHVSDLKKEGFVRVGRGFVDLCEKGKRYMGAGDAVFFILRVAPQKKDETLGALTDLKYREGDLYEEGSEIYLQIKREYEEDFMRYLAAFEGIVGIQAVYP